MIQSEACWSPIRICLHSHIGIWISGKDRIFEIHIIDMGRLPNKLGWQQEAQLTHKHCVKHTSCVTSRWKYVVNLVLPKGLGLGSRERTRCLQTSKTQRKNILQILIRDPNRGWLCLSYILHDCWFCLWYSWVFTLTHSYIIIIANNHCYNLALG